MNSDWEARHQERMARHQERMARRRQRWEQRRWNPHASANPMGGIIFGLLLIGGGLLFLLRNLNIVYFDNIWDYWPVILIVIGGSKLATARGVHEIAWGLILGGLGVVFLLKNLDIIHVSVWGFIWPTLLILVGLSFLFRDMYGPDWFGGRGLTDTSESTADRLHEEVVFGGIDRKITSQSFEGGTLSAVFGGVDIDLRGAAMQKPEVKLNADAVFGGIDLKVPDTWEVVTKGSGVFGSFENQTHKPVTTGSTPAPRLVVTGGAVFGGVTIRN